MTTSATPSTAQTRVVNVTAPGAIYDVYVGRANARYRLECSKWANPFRIQDGYTRESSISAFRDYLFGMPDLLEALPELKGKVLGCWCFPLKCHADVLAELALHPAEMPSELKRAFRAALVGETMVMESCIACAQTWGIPGSEQAGKRGDISWQILRKHLAECWGSERRSRPRGER